MHTYSYEADDDSGQPQHGTIEAESLADAVEQLEKGGLSIRTIAVQDSHEDATPDVDEAFQLQLTELLERRSDWVPSLRAMVEEMPAGTARRVTNKLVRQLEQEMDVSQLLSGTGAVRMLPLLTSGRDAAIGTGRLRDWLADLVRSQQTAARRRRLWIYPVALFALTAIILITFSFFLIPIFREMYQEFGLFLPAPTLWTFWIADQISTYLLRTVVVGLVMLLLIIPLVHYWRSRSLTNRFLGKLAAGSSANLRSMSALTSTLAELLALKCPLPRALQMAGRACNCLYYEHAAHQLSHSIEQGVELEQCERGTRLPPSVVQAMTAGGQQQPSVPLLRELATVYSERALSRRDSLIESLPAVGVILLGLLIGFVIISLFMPLVSMVTSLA